MARRQEVAIRMYSRFHSINSYIISGKLFQVVGLASHAFLARKKYAAVRSTYSKYKMQLFSCTAELLTCLQNSDLILLVRS